MIIEEIRAGLIANTAVRWLVSCKHFAFTRSSVRPDDEKNVHERVRAAQCHGFLGFYSTLPSAGLSELLHRQSEIEIKFLDCGEIERHLLASAKGRLLIERYFPDSAKKLHHVPPKIFDDLDPILCDNCDKNLLEPPSGMGSLDSSLEWRK